MSNLLDGKESLLQRREALLISVLKSMKTTETVVKGSEGQIDNTPLKGASGEVLQGLTGVILKVEQAIAHHLKTTAERASGENLEVGTEPQANDTDSKTSNTK